MYNLLSSPLSADTISARNMNQSEIISHNENVLYHTKLLKDAIMNNKVICSIENILWKIQFRSPLWNELLLLSIVIEPNMVVPC